MAEIVSLNRFRKVRERAKAEQKAEENRVRYGRTKLQKDQARRQVDKEATELDGKQLD